MDSRTRRAVLKAQQNEITEYHIYNRLAARAHAKNKKILKQIAKDELGHYNFWKKLTKEEVQPRAFSIWLYLFLAKILGLTFALRLMEKGEDLAQHAYEKLSHIKGIDKLLHDEEQHEQQLISVLKEEHLEYAGSFVLGLNDALVELTGALAGLTFALQNTRVVAVAGFVTGFAASLSMAASEYLQAIEESEHLHEKDPLRAAFYTGVAYIITVLILIAPYFLLQNIYIALTVTLCLAILVVLSYTFYITTAKRLPFWPRFLKMATISLGVAAISFGVGMAMRTLFGIEV